MKKRFLLVFAVAILLASVSVVLGTAQMLTNNGRILDVDAQHHVANLLSGARLNHISAPAALVPVTPQPTAQPKPTLAQIILAVFGVAEAKQAMSIAQCVSNMNASLVTPDHYGLFQIRLSTLAASPYKNSNLLDPMVNSKVAYWLYMQSGKQWYRWGACAPPLAVSSPPPTPVPQSVQAFILSVFGQFAQGALSVARCESGFNPGAYNPTPVGASHAEGVFQVLYPSTWQTTGQRNSSPYDAHANIQAAFEIFMRDGFSWREWVCQPV